MKLKIIISLMLSLFIQNSFCFDGVIQQLQTSPNKEILQGFLGALDRSINRKQDVKVLKRMDKNECLNVYFDNEGKREIGRAVPAIYLVNRISTFDVNGDVESLKFNSWNTASVPHLDVACQNHWVITSSEIRQENNKLCRVVTRSLDSYSYELIYCAGSDQVFVKH